MERKSGIMNAGQLALAIVVSLSAIFAPLTPVARAQTAGETGEETEVVWADGGGGEQEIERWWGAAGAILCGAEIRLIRVVPAIGMNPYAIAAGLGGCLLAVMDVVTS